MAVINGSGTPYYVPVFTTATDIGDSQVYDNGSFVGIGYTADPGTGNKLGVNGNLYVNGDATLRSTSVSQAATFGLSFLNSGNTSPALSTAAGIFAITGYPNWDDGTSLAFLVNPGPVTSTSAVEAMRISPAGKVGLGTVTPIGHLHVKGTDTHVFFDRATSSDYAEMIFGTGGAREWTIGTRAGSTDLYFNTGSGGSTQTMKLSTGGN